VNLKVNAAYRFDGIEDLSKIASYDWILKSDDSCLLVIRGLLRTI
jgi:hypothetical protein